MKKSPIPPADSVELRRRAEARLKGKKGGEAGKGMTPFLVKEAQRLVQELQVHQIELEMQNEELKSSRVEVEAGLALYADLYDFAPVGYFTLDRDGMIRRANLTGASLLGTERGRLATERFAHFVSAADRPAFNTFLQKVFTSRKKETCETALRTEKKKLPSPGLPGNRSSGETDRLVVSIEAVASENDRECRVVMSDITGRKQAETALQQAYDEMEQRVVARTEELRRAYEELKADIAKRKRAEKNLIETVQQLQETRDMLIQFEKHAAVGRLAAGVAHEILNPVSIISSRLQFLEATDLTDQARESVRICREQLQRITKTSQDLRQSAAKQPGLLVGGDLCRVIEVGLQMTKRRIKEDHVQVEYDPPSGVIPVKMERDRLVKVMVNLILNACDAMTGNQEKRLIITVYCQEHSSKDYSISLTVADNGQGIPTGNLNLIFEPFFTTKDPGKGTGLGLSVSKGIIREHSGTIHAENNDMGGASFIIELPFDRP